MIDDHKQDPRHRRVLFGIVALAVLLRLVWAWIVPVIPLSDGLAYDAFARNLAEHRVFGWTRDAPFAFWPPGTSFFHGLVYWAFGVRYEGIVALNILVSGIVIVASARLARRFFGARVALVTATILAVWPTLVMYTTVLASELLYLAFCMLALDVWTGGMRNVWLRAFAAGGLIGVAALIRPLALLLPVVYGGAAAISAGIGVGKVRKEQLLLCVGATLAMAVVVAPWTWRNFQLYGEPVLVSTNGGITLWMGNAPGTTGGYLSVPPDVASLPDHQQSKVLGERARRYILDDPLGFALRSAWKLGLLYGNESIGVVWNAEGIAQALGERFVVPLKRFTQVTWAVLMALAIAGLVRHLRYFGVRETLFSPVLLPLLYYSAVYSITVAQDRYHLSFAAPIAMLAALGVTWTMRREHYPHGKATVDA